MPIGETLQAFALQRGEPADEHGVYPCGLVSDFRCDHRGVAAAFKDRADISADSRMRMAVADGADICLQIRSVHHHGRVILAHVRGQASRNLATDMAMGLRTRHADDILSPVHTGGRIPSGCQASRDLGAVLGQSRVRQRQDGRRMPVRGERVSLLLGVS